MVYKVELTVTDWQQVEATGRTMRQAYYRARKQIPLQSDRDELSKGFAHCFLAMSFRRKSTHAVSYSNAARSHHVRIERNV